MARRNDIDWEAVERDYRAGILTVAQMADRHNVSSSQIKVKAKAGGWTRDLSEAIHARAKAKIAAIDVAALVEKSATESAEQSAKTISQAIEQASDATAGVIMSHRADIRQMAARTESLEKAFDKVIADAETIGDVARAAQALKNLIDSRAKLIDKQREAFGISGGDGGDDDTPSGVALKFVSANGS